MPTTEGDAFVFMAVDVFSDFVFITGVEKTGKKKMSSNICKAAGQTKRI